MNSERLPGKVMRYVGGKPLIGILLNRLAKCDIPILLATSTNPENDVIVDYVKSQGVKTFRGSEDNVLERFFNAAKSVNADVVIRATADNPFLDGFFVKDALGCFEKELEISKRSYLSSSLSQTYPIGISIEIFSTSLLEEAYRKASKTGELEHVTPYMHQNVPGDITIKKLKINPSKYHYRLTIDTESDFLLAKKLIEEYGCVEKSTNDIIQVMDQNPTLLNINKHSNQKSWDE